MSLSSVLYVCAAATLFPAIAAKSAAMNQHQLELKEHYEHLAKIAEFECDQPQPRLLNVHDLLSAFQLRGKAFFPEVSVLHRCDRHVGSCNSATYQCGPTNTTEVKMPFKVTFLEEMEGHAKGEWQMEYYPLQNHTTCGCLKSEGVPPPKTAVHYHYVDPTLMKPQTCLSPDTNSHNLQGNSSSYDVPFHQISNTQQSSRNESEQEPEREYNVPSIYDMTKLAEEEVKPKPDEERSQYPGPSESQYPEYSVYQPSSESSTAYEIDSFTTPKVPSFTDNDKNDADNAAIPSELIRFGNGDSPRSEALTNSESPYETHLRQASS